MFPSSIVFNYRQMFRLLFRLCPYYDGTRNVLMEATLSAFVPSFRPFRPKNKLSLKGENDIKR